MAVLIQPPGLDTADTMAFSRELSLPGVAHVAILMCTYNGASFLRQQLDSFEQQTYRNWSLHVSDDGSEDRTPTVLQSYAELWGAHRVKVFDGPRAGFVRNFLSLTCRADINADYFAWSDQDDIWSPEKLQVAVEWLQGIPSEVPAMYCGRTQLICEGGIHRGLSPNFSLPPHFKNALVQSIGGGNTMVFNKAARSMILEAGSNLEVPSHDWWCYQLITGAGGIVHYDPQPRVFYRQHEYNVIGANSDWPARIRRLVMVFQGRFYQWNAQNIRALETMNHRLSNDHRKTLALFKAAREQRLPARLANVFRAGLHRQTLLGNLGLFLATLLKKI
ncbi:glycosyltransferase family 2 protein [Pseudomonas parasichuanensis]|uniref:glycosyltransferase family 2 protein n=1 Tax=Pseudomonas parasichuanensis TaxID=2892329 RepID=UPI00283A96A4|nr:glycosyltransferase family 2 protein [Pseudomonas parasichuanensis]